MSRKHTHAYAAFQRGKGLVGFLAGLVLATMIIIAVLLMLNSNSKRDFQNTSPATPPTTDTLRPAGVANESASPAAVADNTITAEDRNLQPMTASEVPALPTSPSVTETALTQTNTTTETVPETENTNGDNNIDIVQPIDKKDELDNMDVSERTPIETEKPPVIDKPRTSNKHIERDGVSNNVRPNHNPDGKRTNTNTGNLHPEDLQDPPKSKPPVKTEQPKPLPSVKPTEPVKKAEPTLAIKPKTETKTVTKPKTEPAKPVEKTKPTPPNMVKPKQVDTKPTPQQILDAGNIEKARELAQKQTNTPAASNKPSNAKRVIIQAGAYSSRNAADAQRARLALLGVKAQIVEANVNGKPTYRVQTARLEGAQVSNTRNVLQRNGVATLERSAD